VDVGRDYAHVGQIFPFKDRPDVGVKVLFYPVPLSRDAVPYPNPFVLRNWDKREGLPQTPLGTDQAFKILFFGKKPTGLQGTVCGGSDLWTNGVSYADWIAGRYGTGCVDCSCGVWSELCQTILPTTLNVSGTFPNLAFPFATTAAWRQQFFPGAGTFNVWDTGPLPYVCDGSNQSARLLLIERPDLGTWFFEGFDTVGRQIDVQPAASTACNYPQSWVGGVFVAVLAASCDFGIGEQRPFVFATFSAP
jgi:hypothetical protein